MIPGGPRNERQMQMMMRRLGMTTTPVEDVEEVIVRTKTQEHVFKEPEVTIMTVQGIKTYQIVGEPKVQKRGAAGPAGASGTAAPPSPPAGPPEEDVQLVMDQAQVERPEAIAALKSTNGEPAEAILQILKKRGPGGG
jgi:nascent polypeptide-associated complex subunit alpha